MKFTKEELDEFFKTNKPVDYERDDVDSSGNRWGARIYQLDEKFYKLGTLDGRPLETYESGKGYVDYYTLHEVKRIEVMEYYYEDID